MNREDRRSRNPDRSIVGEQEVPFLARWSRRKRDIAGQDDDAGTCESAALDSKSATPPPPVSLTDADMPPVETLNEQSDFSAFLSPDVSERLRGAALKKLFQLSAFNVRDGLDDYDDDFTYFEPLGDTITADMRHQMELAEQRRLAAEAEQTTDADDQAVADVVDEGDTRAAQGTEQISADESLVADVDEREQPPDDVARE